ncbi:protein ABIL1 isoform X1 [Tanacetum coccineum]
MGFNEPSMEHNISFVKALQVNMVLDNIKDYAVRALVNAVDHIGTVAYKLTDVVDQQTSEISTTSLHVTCLQQQLLTCETYTDREALRQQQLLAVVPRHHKHYILPSTPSANTLCWHLASETKSTLKRNSSSMSVEGIKTSGRASMSSHASNGIDRVQTKSSEAHLKLPKMGPASSAAIQTLGISRQDSVEGQNPMMSFRSFDNPKCEIPRAPIPLMVSKPSGRASVSSHASNGIDGVQTKSSEAHLKLPKMGPASSAAIQTLGISRQDSAEGQNPMKSYAHMDNPKCEVPRAPMRSKSVLSSFFVKQKTSKLRTSAVS